MKSERLEEQLSLYCPTSEIAQVNRRAFERPAPVSPNAFRLLECAAELSRATGGAFDPTIAPRAVLGFHGREGVGPTMTRLTLLDKSGSNGVELNSAKFTVRFSASGDDA